MKIVSVRLIDGPNVYLYKPILVAKIHLDELTEKESTDYPGFTERLLRLLPGLNEHHCAKGQPGGFVERLYGGTYFGHIVEHVAIELATCIGLDVHYGKTMYDDAPGHYRIVMECKAYECQRWLLTKAMNLVEAVLNEKEVSLQDIDIEAKKILAQTELGPSTLAIIEACQKMNIPFRRIGKGSFLQLGYGRFRKRIEATITDQSSAVAVDIACDKEMTKLLLEEGGIPVPQGGVAHNFEEALQIYRDLGGSVVMKPYNGNQGRGVSLNLQDSSSLKEAYEIAGRYSSKVIVENYIQGKNVRILVVGGKFVAASERIPAYVVGDGHYTIEKLIERINRDPRRGRGHEKPLTQIQIDDVVLTTLAKQGWTMKDIPAQGEYITLRDSANLSTGGQASDITEKVHASYIQLSERVARLVGLDVCGIDLVMNDWTKPAASDNWAVIEVNAAPGIRMHEYPSFGQSRRVAEAIVQSLFPFGSNGRIPLVSITGTNGKTTTTRLIAHAIQNQGKVVGMTTTSGVYIGSEKILEGDTTGPASARMILSDPQVDVAVLETARGGICRGGLAYDKADIAVLTNITLDHVGQDGVDSIEDLVKIKSLVAECVFEDGTVVLNADDPQLVKLLPRLKSNITLFSTKVENENVKRHLARGGTVYYLAHGWIVEAKGDLTRELVRAAEIPLTVNGTALFQVENCLAAIAALRAYGLSRQEVIRSILSFDPQVHNQGRCMIYKLPNHSHVVLDYGHNPGGFLRMGEWLQTIPHRTLIGVIGVPGDRANHVIEQSVECLAGIFDAFVIKEDEDKRGRNVGEVAKMIEQRLRTSCPEKSRTIVLSEKEALQVALKSMHSGDVTVVFYEKVQPLLELVQMYGGCLVSTIEVREAAFALP